MIRLALEVRDAEADEPELRLAIERLSDLSAAGEALLLSLIGLEREGESQERTPRRYAPAEPANPASEEPAKEGCRQRGQAGIQSFGRPD